MVQIASAAPVLLVSDVFATAEYYRDVLGFSFGEIHGDPPSFVVVRRDGAQLMFRQPSRGQPQPANGAVSPAFPIDVFLHVDDVDALAHELRARRADILDGPTHRAIWNGKELTVRDCDGRVLCFGQAMD
ncbi:MAG: VOC family protein [Phenylobacterium sp.]|uniref:VOC family protein n=1 Tax=Phenylobacterium sp. TaxID=1871053 RepID=UPI00391B2061